MELEKNIQSIFNSQTWAKDLWRLTNKKFHKLRLLLEKDAELPPGMGEKLEFFFFSLIYLAVTKNPKRYLVTKRKYIGKKSPLAFLVGKDPTGKIISQDILNESECNHLINSYRILPELLLSSANKLITQISKDYSEVNNELSIAHSMLKVRKKRMSNSHKEFKIDFILKNLPEVRERIKREAENCRKNGKISYRKLGRVFEVSHHTAKRWCEKLSIKPEILQLKSSSTDLDKKYIKIRKRKKNKN